VTSPMPTPEAPAAALAAVPQLEPVRNTVLAGIGALLMFGPLAFGAVEPWAVFVLQAAAVVLLAIWLLRRLRSGRVVVASNPVFIPMGLFAAVLVLQLLPGVSAYRHATWSGLLLYIAYGVICFLVTQTLRRTTQVRWLTTAFSGFGIFLAGFAILQSLSSNGRLYWVRTPRFGGWIYGPYVNHNHYAGLMEMLAPITLVYAFSRYAHGRKRWLAAAAAALMGATIFLSGSRGGMAAFSLQMALFLWVLFRERTRNRTALLLCGFLLTALALVSWIGGSEVSARLSTVTTRKTEISSDTRMQINRDGLRMFSRRPLLGWGLGTFEWVYPQYRSFYTDGLVDQAHNDYLQLLIETGIAGGVLALWLLVAALRRAWAKARNWTGDVNGAVALASLLGISGILVHSLADFNLQVPANALLFYVLCTIAGMQTSFRNPQRVRNLLAEQGGETMLDAQQAS